MRQVLSVGTLGLLLATAAAAQGLEPKFSEDRLVEILRPAAPRPPLTRGLKWDQDEQRPAAGEAGSGVLPDLEILFAFNSAELTEAGRAQLDELGQALSREELSSLNFLIGGHTDAVGSDGYNFDLSRRRAEAVVTYLTTGFGIAPDRLSARGYGETALALPDEPTDEKNRRVEIRSVE